MAPPLAADDDGPGGRADGRARTAGLKANVGVYTNVEHGLYVGAAEPSAESVAAGSSLKEGEVTIAIRSTGICG